MFIHKKIGALFIVFSLLLTAYSFSQEYRNSGFIKPMNLPFNLAGSFGEPRPDHFHSGIDIKTNGVEGEPVFAVYDGYISRIRVSPYGYGRAIYITHTNGFTSVYGHLSKFYGAIEKYIHTQHYTLKKSELDLTLNAGIFPVKQNDTIAFSGNTGGSTAPHLHFEVRNTKNEHALNPLDFYPRSFYVDTIPPQINKVKVNIFSAGYFYNSFRKNYYNLPTKERLNFSEPNYAIDYSNYYSFSLEGYDKQDNSENKNGINKIEVLQNDSLVFKYDLTEIDFDKTRMCNAFVDYTEMMNGSGYFYNCYQLKNNSLPIYMFGNGFFANGQIDSVAIYDIYCYDYNKNKTKIKFEIPKSNSITDYEFLNWKKDSIAITERFKNMTDSISLPGFQIRFTENTFYDDIYLTLSKRFIRDTAVYKISTDYNLIPLHKPAKIEFNSSIKKNRKKIVIVRQDNKGKETALKTTFDKTKFYAETKELGSFYLKYDTTKPTIEIPNLKSQIPNLIIQAKISDELSGINTYNGYVDNKWVNFYYDAKNDVILYNFDEYCTKGEHTLKIIVTDNVGNKNTITNKFNY
ncbi:MAG TPA: M23 family metallopeptidase [Chitinophagales bacterium]|nr:M23 family metallopeptidase [Chitinophagales bacterium]